LSSAFTRAALFVAHAVVLLLALISCAAQAPSGDVPQAKFELRLTQEAPGEGLTEASVEDSDKKVYLSKEALITNKDLISARVVENEGLLRIDVKFTEEGAERMSRASAANIGKRIAIVVDGKVLSAPIVMGVISDTAAISGPFTREEAERLARRIAAK